MACCDVWCCALAESAELRRDLWNVEEMVPSTSGRGGDTGGAAKAMAVRKTAPCLLPEQDQVTVILLLVAASPCLVLYTCMQCIAGASRLTSTRQGLHACSCSMYLSACIVPDRISVSADGLCVCLAIVESLIVSLVASWFAQKQGNAILQDLNMHI